MSGAGNQFHVVSFSGGKDSTAMLLMMIEKGLRVGAAPCRVLGNFGRSTMTSLIYGRG